MPEKCFRKVGRERVEHVGGARAGWAARVETAQFVTQALKRAGSGQWPQGGSQAQSASLSWSPRSEEALLSLRQKGWGSGI